jgi:hypothetical protein
MTFSTCSSQLGLVAITLLIHRYAEASPLILNDRLWPTALFFKIFEKVRYQSQTAIHDRWFKDRFWPSAAVAGTAKSGRVRMWRGSLRLGLSVPAPFVWRCPSSVCHHPVSTSSSSNRTCRFTASGSRTVHHAFTHATLRPRAQSAARARSARRGARVDSSRPCVA